MGTDSSTAEHGQDANADSELLERAHHGDREAVGRLYDRHAAPMLGLARRFLHDREDAEDLVHDVFLEAWQRAGDYVASRGSVRAWLMLRVRSRALDRLRHTQMRAGKAAAIAAHAETELALPPTGEPDRARARDALAALPAPNRQVLELAYFGGLTCREIAVRCDTAEGTVKSRMASGLSQLRSALGVRRGEES